MESKLFKNEAFEAKSKDLEAKVKLNKTKAEEMNELNKTFKNKIEELNKQLKTCSRDLKTSEKNKRDTAHKLEKQISVRETKNKSNQRQLLDNQ